MAGECVGCGQLALVDGGSWCAQCAAARYGGGELHEAVRLFEPEEAPIPGQTTMIGGSRDDAARY